MAGMNCNAAAHQTNDSGPMSSVTFSMICPRYCATPVTMVNTTICHVSDCHSPKYAARIPKKITPKNARTDALCNALTLPEPEIL